ncbi:NUDIX domain-containing protein [Leptospira levettii]|uniref:NUDIX domain-containing protein n=1 Tax=Leptospira levettii TaxID=2023178 RepID=UPI0010837C60|nr:NUDIX domain-containing protein [Leptospira levettii]TGM44744.1 NUDIX domain-containing protein [Leptospira levettii]
MSKHGFFQISQKLFLRDGNSLLVLRDQKSGHGDLPGGRMNEDEFFEDWMESVYREINEELGESIKIDVNPKPIFVHKHKVNEGNFPCIIIAYEAKLKQGKVRLSDEHDYMEWVDIHSFDPKTLFSEYMLEAVQLYLNQYA